MKSCLHIFFVALLATTAFAAEEPAPRTEADILSKLKLPDGFTATVFAQPPQLGYPTSVSAAIDGTIFVAVDENGSLDRIRNTPEKARGYVLRLRDADGDGRAEEIIRFAEMESPRGVIWDGNGMGADGKMPGTLYVMHPPNLTAYIDVDGDGESDRQEDIVTGLGFGLEQRGADHTTNGIRLAIDGFIYIAVGDYGFVNAVAHPRAGALVSKLRGQRESVPLNPSQPAESAAQIAAGRAEWNSALQMRGGGIVRVRPDGTGFEIVSRGQRNIYDVAIAPTLDLFTRDNTNDGGGWNVRLSFVPPGAQMGYPTLFKNFAEAIVPPLADFGGGSPCGALWIDEPGLPSGLFTVEWGANAIMHHPLKQKGAGWELDPTGATDPKLPGQVKWLGITRPTDMDVDAAGRIYITSWEGATFTYNGPNAGYVLRVAKKDSPRVDALDLVQATREQLADYVTSTSASIRLAAQRSILRRHRAAQRAFNERSEITPDLKFAVGGYQGGNPGGIQGYLRSKVESKSVHLVGQIAALHTCLLAAANGYDFENSIRVFTHDLENLRANPEVLACILRAWGNNKRFVPFGAGDLIHAALTAPEPRVRAAAITALRRLGKADASPQIIPLVADEDPIIAHLAIGALRELQAAAPLLAALDSAMTDASESVGGTGVSPVGVGVPPAPSASPATRTAMADGALRALHSIYTPEVVDGLIARLGDGAQVFNLRGQRQSVPLSSTASESSAAQNAAGRAGSNPALPFDLRRGILNALCRLANQDAPYLDLKEWWGTRPDTSGPVYKPVAWSESAKIEAALKTALDASSEDDARWLVQRMYLTKVNFPGLVELMLTKAGSDTAAKLTAIDGMFRADNALPAEAAVALKTIALSEQETPDLRAKALRQLARGSSHGGVFPAAVETFATFAGHDIGQPALTAVFEDFTRDAKQTKRLGDWAKLASASDGAQVFNLRGQRQSVPLNAVSAGRPAEEASAAQIAASRAGYNPAPRTLAQTVLVNLATSALVKGKDHAAAEAAVEQAWAQPDSAASLLGVIARTGAKAYAEQVKARLKDPHNAVAEAALFAYQALGLGETTAPAKTIAELKYEMVFALVQRGGDVAAGKELSLRAGCIACHTLTADEPPKGPVLNAVAKIYDRPALTESILKPNAKLAQGFESAFFTTKKGEQIEGFVTREGGDSLDVRNVVGQTVTLEKSDIAERGHRPQSMMPEGLMNAFTTTELANLLAYLESLKGL